MSSQVEKLPGNTYKFKITVPAFEVENIRASIIDDYARESEISGFRKGMAPREMVEKSIDSGKLRTELLNRSVAKFYAQAIKESLLKPIIYPKVVILQFEDNKDLIFEAVTCEKPMVDIGNYIKALEELSKERNPNEGKDAQIGAVLDKALAVSPIEISDLLLDEEVNHMLGRLVDQTGRLGITVDQYLESAGKTVDQLKIEYREMATKTIKTEFILLEIAKERRIEVAEKEISDMIKAAPDEKTRQSLSEEDKKTFIRSIILKNKVIEELLRTYREGKDGKIKLS